jgi:hypothetical protein
VVPRHRATSAVALSPTDIHHRHINRGHKTRRGGERVEASYQALLKQSTYHTFSSSRRLHEAAAAGGEPSFTATGRP